MKVLLVVAGLLSPIEVSTIETCELMTELLREQDREAACTVVGKPTKSQMAHMERRLDDLMIKQAAAKARRAVQDWCVTVAVNGSYSGRVFMFVDKLKFWPTEKKPSLERCRLLIAGHHMELTEADLRRGYTGENK